MNPTPNPTLARKLLVEAHGTVDQQKDELVDLILRTFQIPERWPFEDSARIALLRDLYERARRIRALKEPK